MTNGSLNPTMPMEDSRNPAALQHELNGILAMVDRMQAVDTKGIEPMSHPQQAMQRLREDEAREPDLREKYQDAAPATEDGLYLVPKVIE